MGKKKPYYIVIDLYDLRKSTIAKSLKELSHITGKHRNTLQANPEGIHGHHMVIIHNPL